ncbi:MAG: thiamine pyrophosphate-dependent enzyme [Steroidobacteraceae bacterium]
MPPRRRARRRRACRRRASPTPTCCSSRRRCVHPAASSWRRRRAARRHARPPADPRARHLLHRRERRARIRPAGRRGHRARPPGRARVALLGDGSTMYSVQGMWSAAQHRLPITFVIVRNGCYEGLNEFGRLFRMDYIPGAELPGLDFCALARGFGIDAVRVTHCGELDAALTRALASTGPALLEVVVER